MASSKSFFNLNEQRNKYVKIDEYLLISYRQAGIYLPISLHVLVCMFLCGLYEFVITATAGTVRVKEILEVLADSVRVVKH